MPFIQHAYHHAEPVVYLCLPETACPKPEGSVCDPTQTRCAIRLSAPYLLELAD
jgi:hypothetical protein